MRLFDLINYIMSTQYTEIIFSHRIVGLLYCNCWQQEPAVLQQGPCYLACKHIECCAVQIPVG